MNLETKLPPVQEAINELREGATTPEDQAYLDTQQNELDKERAGIGSKTLELVQQQDGSIVTKDDVRRIQAEGQDASGPYGASGRRS